MLKNVVLENLSDLQFTGDEQLRLSKILMMENPLDCTHSLLIVPKPLTMIVYN